MLRRTRYVLPLLAIAAALLGATVDLPPWVLIAIVGTVGLATDLLLSHIAEMRVRAVADQVVAFAGEVRSPPSFQTTGGPEWQRMVTALQEVADILLDRFEALRDERERVERVLDTIPSAVLLFTGGVLAYANPSAQEMFGLPRTREALTPVRAMGVMGLAQAVDEIAETGRDLEVQVTRDGRQLFANGSSVAPGEVALIVSDLTELKRVEAMRRDFVANASHELKTPVTGMQALADSLDMAMERDPERAKTMVGRIQIEATRLARLVRDLLDLTRLEEDDPSARVRIDVAMQVKAQVERVQEIADQAGVTLNVDAADASIVGVAEDIRLIVRNLVLNAIKYNSPGGRVDVAVGRRPGQVVLEVTDNGIGIPEASHDRIFERFYRIDKARSRAAGGTGLGLSLVRNAVDRHAGTVSVKSVLGEGSTFTVVLPVDGGIST